MNDPVISRFAAACGAAGPLDLRVELAGGKVLAEGTVPMPFALVGRDDGCDVTLADAEVDPRHAWLQVLGGRVLAVDLGARAGIGWPGGTTGSGWLDAGTPVRVGPFLLRLRAPASARPDLFPSGYDPLRADPAGARWRPPVALEFRNGRRAKDRWAVDRPVTLVGRAPECKVQLTAGDIARYHCGLVLTPAGLWVVDLSGRGVVVNGERMRVSPLPPAAELWVGRFLIGVRPDPAAAPPRPAAQPAPPSPPPAAPEDEVPVGTPPGDQGSGLPSSHVMADAFRPPSAGGSVSSPILVGVSGAHAPPPAPAPAPDPAGAAGLVRRLADRDAGALGAAAESLPLLARLLAAVGPDRLAAVRRELDRVFELDAELAELRAEVTRRAAEAADPLPDPAGPNDWAAVRVEALRKERQARWQAVAALVADPPPPAAGEPTP